MANVHQASAARVLDTASKSGAAYADVQFWNARTESTFARNGVIRGVNDDRSIGYSVRAYVDGSWGFAGSDDLTDEGFDAAAARATAIAKASARIVGRIRAVQPTAKIVDSWSTPVTIEPETVSLSQRANELLAAEKAAHIDKRIVSAYAFLNIWTTQKEFYATTGSAIDQRIVQAGSGVGVTAIGPDRDPQSRSGPGDFGFYQSGGYEVIRAARLAEHAPTYAREAVMLTTAPVLPEMTTALIIPGQLLNLQMHESIGHPLELDRSLGWEANFSGISWATPDAIGKLKYGSELLTVYADNSLPGGMATTGYDDEGIKPQRVMLIEKGVLRAFLSSRDTAAQTNLPETASSRAQDWASIPMVRMTNIALEPGSGTLESIIADTKEGVYVDGTRSWSIDDHRLNFQFGPQLAYEIRNGKRVKLYKKPTYQGYTPDFWGGLDRVAGPEEFVVWGTPNCGKGEPEQSGRTSHACSHARFSKVRLGVKANA